jgi:hypothetical protein
MDQGIRPTDSRIQKLPEDVMPHAIDGVAPRPDARIDRRRSRNTSC